MRILANMGRVAAPAPGDLQADLDRDHPGGLHPGDQLAVPPSHVALNRCVGGIDIYGVDTGDVGGYDVPVGGEVVTTESDVAALGTILGVWAHPDDEAYLSGGLMAMARNHGSRVVCVTATRGELGTPDPVAWPPERLAAERTDELARSLEILGVTEHHWLGYADGGCAEVPAAEPVERLGGLIEQVQPDTVLTFGPDGITGHPDHQAVSVWTAAALDLAAPRSARLLQATVAERRVSRWSELHASLSVFLPGYPVIDPTALLAVDLVLDPDIAARKVRALAAQATQTTGLIATLGVDRYAAWVGDETFVERV
jgi:LmbE family N-acetylglucosaminyl deacetylase